MPDIAEIIAEVGAIKRGTFELSSGAQSDYYIDKYVFETNPRALDAIADAIADRLTGDDIDVIAGPALGAIPLVTAVSLRTGIPSAYIRQGTKGYGTNERVEGTIAPGSNVAIIEDVTTSGGTVIESLELVEEIGGVIRRVLVVVDRGEGAADNVADAGYDLEYLTRVGEDLIIDDRQE